MNIQLKKYTRLTVKITMMVVSLFCLFSVNLYKEYSYLKLSDLEELPCFGVTIWQPSQLLWSALYYFSSNSFPFANLEKNRDMRNLF